MPVVCAFCCCFVVIVWLDACCVCVSPGWPTESDETLTNRWAQRERFCWTIPWWHPCSTTSGTPLAASSTTCPCSSTASSSPSWLATLCSLSPRRPCKCPCLLQIATVDCLNFRHRHKIVDNCSTLLLVCLGVLLLVKYFFILKGKHGCHTWIMNNVNNIYLDKRITV